MAMTLRPLDQLDLVTGCQGHDRLLPVGAPPLGAAHPLQLSLERGCADGRHLDVEHALDGRPDLHLVRVGPHPERHSVLLFLLPHALFRHQRTDQDLAGGPAHDNASSSATRPARSHTTRCACSSWYTDTWAGVSTVIQGTLRAARVSPPSSSRTTMSVETPATPRPESRPTSDFVFPSRTSSVSTADSSPAAILAAIAARSASRRIVRGMSL